MNHFKDWEVGFACLVCFIVGVVLAGFLNSGGKPAREVCAERGGLYMNSTCVKVDKIDLGERIE